MPLYEYQCTECGTRVEILQRLSDPPLETCATCGAAVTKLLSAPAFQFKGSGWYVTDYGGKKETTSEGDSVAGSDGESAGKSAGDKSNGDSSAPKESSTSKPKSDKKDPAPTKSSST